MKKMITAVLVLLTPAAAFGADGQVWKSPTCGCCKSWVSHMAANGFALDVQQAGPSELNAVKAQSGVPKAYASCHTAKIGGYVVEGHVPAEAVKRLLAEKPDAVGLSVPGMPEGSPGMETGGAAEPYDVLLIRKDGTAEVFQHVATP